MSETRTPLVVLLHGACGGPADFAGVTRRLPERFGCRVPPLSWDEPAAASVDRLASRLEEEFGAEERGVVLVGSGQGASLALALARRSAGRLSGLVLSGCPEADGFGVGDRPGGAPPTLLLWGTEDRIAPPDVGRRLREQLPGARLLFVPDAGHLPMVDRPAAFAFHVSSFLNDLAPALRPPRRLVDEAA